MTRAQVKDSPDVDTRMPVCRQQEVELRRYYQWPAYGAAVGIGRAIYPVPELLGNQPVHPPEPPLGQPVDEGSDQMPHLRSVAKVTGYSILARDGDLGHVEDLIVDDEPLRVLLFPSHWL